MKNIHPEFAYQSRELGIQIEDTLGDPPDKRNYATVVKSLLGEYAKGSGIDDVNFLSFALADSLQFNDPAGLLAQSARYEEGDAPKVLKMVSCDNAEASKALENIAASDPELARKAIITAFLFKNHNRWTEEDHSLESLQEGEDNEDDENEDRLEPGHDIEHLFDQRGDE
ncbi:MAG: hypothetical protein EPO42_13705 [Gallionellaceae bacterium]|nr:MAG: hypothetical protein EPO42_13705 [Gallionellaceae bacterium]